MKKRNIIRVLMLLLVLTICIAVPANGATNLLPTASDNLQTNLRSFSEIVETESGFMRVFYDDENIRVEYYDNSFVLKSKKTVPMELTYWGGFYAAKDAYYIVVGQDNLEESYNKEIIRVIKYDKNWNRLAAAKITGNSDLFGGDVRYPFDYGCVEMTEHNGTLYIVTGHEGYVDSSVGRGHQGFLMIAVNQSAMTGSIVDCDLWHSFAQYIETDNEHLYVLEQSEGSRYTQLSKYNMTDYDAQSIPVLKYGGSRTSAWAVRCYASVDDLALSANNVLCIGTSIDQSLYDNVTSDTAHNIYLTVTPKDRFTEESTAIKWITDYTGNGKSFLGVKLTKLNDNRFMISWEESAETAESASDDSLSGYILHYLFVDGNGNVISKEYTAAAPISDCSPIVVDNKVVYYASSANMVNFYTIDGQSGVFSKKIYRVAGEKATWKISGSTLNITGEGAINVDTEAGYRSPVSSALNSYSYSADDNAWKPVNSKVKKIVIGKGLTSISENAFSGFLNLQEVTIQSGLKSIGKKAFYCCGNLMKITIPSSVTNIGEDCLWMGMYWADDSHAVLATIYTPEGSAAHKYAEKNGIRTVLSHNYGSWKVTKKATLKANGKLRRDCKTCDKYETKTIYKASKINLSYTKTTYNGKVKSPEVVIKNSKGKVISSDNYTVTKAKGRKSVGKYKYKITFKKQYKGTKSLYLTINPKATAVKKVSAVKKGFKVSWSKVSKQTSGYEVLYAKNSKFTKGKKLVKIKGYKNTSKTIKKLSSKKTYYVKVRTYKVVNDKKYYSKWTKVKKIKTK